MSKQPNIFKYATSELSQDAFIAWLLEWSNKKYKTQNEHLHFLGLGFLDSLLAKQSIVLSEVSNLKIKTQYHRIDIFISFEMQGKTYGVIIEDKVFSKNHSKQLARYKQLIENKNYDIVVPIYFKTGFQHCYDEVTTIGYHTYTVKDFSKVLNKGIAQGIDNAIFVSYYEYITEREKGFDDAKYAFENYKSLPISEWNWWSCIGFFKDNEKTFAGKWASVDNNRKSLLAFWFGLRDLSIEDETNTTITVKPYVDIVYSDKKVKIDYRINVNNHPQTNNKNRDKIYNAFKPYLDNAGIKHTKPRFRKAKGTMLLAQQIVFDPSMNHTGLVDNLLKYKAVLDEFVDDFTEQIKM